MKCVSIGRYQSNSCRTATSYMYYGSGTCLLSIRESRGPAGARRGVPATEILPRHYRTGEHRRTHELLRGPVACPRPSRKRCRLRSRHPPRTSSQSSMACPTRTATVYKRHSLQPAVPSQNRALQLRPEASEDVQRQTAGRRPPGTAHEPSCKIRPV
jgi:hypothetical protein